MGTDSLFRRLPEVESIDYRCEKGVCPHFSVKVLMAFILATTATRAGSLFEQFWPEADVYVRTSHNSRLFFQYNGSRVKDEGYNDGQIGVFMDYFLAPLDKRREHRHPDEARSRFVTFRIGYVLDKTPSDIKNPYTAHSAVMELTPRYFLPKRILLTDRNRGDLRFQNGAFVPRYRNRLRLERQFELGRKALTPYAQAEAFYDTRYNAFYRLQYSAGGEFEINKHFVLEAYYLRQQSSRPSFKTQNVLGLTAQFYFR